MFVRTSTETVLLRKATHPSDFFFSISVGKKNKNIHRVGGGERKVPGRKKKMLRRRGRQVPYPISLYEESATGARWLCAFLKHQLPEWSCREAMHCGTGVSDFVIIFWLSLVEDLSLLFMVLWCVYHTYSFCGDMFLSCKSSFCCSSGNIITQNSRCRAITTTTTTTTTSGLFPAYGFFLLECFF